MGTKLLNRETGDYDLVDDQDVASALASKKYIAPEAIAAHRFGQDTYVTPEQLANDQALTPVIDPARAALEQGHGIRERAQSGVIGTGKALVGGTVSGLSGGFVSPFEDAQEFHSLASGMGTAVGAVAPALLGDEAGLLSLARDPVEAERLASTLSSRFMLGGEAAGDIERGLAGARSAVDAAATMPQDLAALDVKGLRAAREAEVERLASEQVARRASVVDDLRGYQDATKAANPWLVIDEGENASRLNRSNKALRNALDDPRGLAESPGSVLKPLRRQEEAIVQTLTDREAVQSRFAKTNAKLADGLAEEVSTLPDSATHVDLTGKLAKRYSAYADVKIGKGATVSIAREDASTFLDALQGGQVHGEGEAAFGKLQGLLEKNRALQTKIEANLVPKAELASSRLSAIDSAKDAFSVPKTKSLLEDMVGGSVFHKVSEAVGQHVPILGPFLGAKVGRLAQDLVFGNAGKAVGAIAERTGAAVKAFVHGAREAAPVIAVTAGAALANARFAETTPAHAAIPVPKGKSKATPDLAALYAARSAELRTQTMYDPTGNVVMRPDARAALAAKLSPIRAADPIAADRIETIKARGVEFLSSKLPRRPDLGVPTGPDMWRPSDFQMRTFARYVAAVENPSTVEERLSNGSITPEDVEAYRAVYPERAAAFEAQILTEMSKLTKPMPYERKLALSILTGRPMDPSLDPRVLRQLTATFANEDGSEGGTRAPVPKPQFGSVRGDAMTPSQERESSLR